MVHELDEQVIACPYCGENITVLIDASVAEQAYIEDCQVCCRPIEFEVAVSAGGEPAVHVFRDDE